MEFRHIDDCWNYLDQFTSVEELEEHLDDLPSEFGCFDIINKSTINEDKRIEICNSYWDNSIGGYEYDYHTICLEEDLL